MNVSIADRIIQSLEISNQELVAPLTRVMRWAPKDANGEIIDPSEPVFHPSTGAHGFPPLRVMFTPSRGFHVCVANPDSPRGCPTCQPTPVMIRKPISECYASAEDAMNSISHDSNARITGAQRTPSAHTGSAKLANDLRSSPLSNCGLPDQ